MTNRCTKHEVCNRPYVLGPDDLSQLLNCMVRRRILKVNKRGKYLLDTNSTL